MVGFGLAIGWMLGLATATRKGKEFRDDLWTGYRKGGIIGKWKVVQKEMGAAGGEFINMVDELFHSPEFEEMVDKGKVHLEKIGKETEKAVKTTTKKIASKAKSKTKSTPKKRATSTARKTTRKTA